MNAYFNLTSRQRGMAAAFAAIAATVAIGSARPAQAADAPSPSASPSQCQYTELATIALDMDGRNTAPVVQGSINGKPVDMLFSTGSQRSYLTKAEADRQGLAMSRQRMQMAGMGGAVSTLLARVPEIALGPTHLSNVNFTVVDGRERGRYGVIIGADFLSQADLEISLAEKQIKFFHADHCQDKALAYWDSKALDIPMEGKSLQDQRQVFEVEVNGHKLRATLNTGAAATLIDLAAAARIGITPQSNGVLPLNAASGIGEEKTAVWSAPFDSFAIGGETIAHPRIRIAELHKTEWFGRDGAEMVLGRDFLKVHHVLMSVSQSRLYFSYLGGQVFMVEPQHVNMAPVVAPAGQP